MSGPVGGTAFHLSAAGTEPLVASGGGILHAVTVNTGASGATVTLYDGPDNTHPVIAVIAAAAQASLRYDARLAAGLTAVVTDAPDVTIVILPSPEYTP